MSVKKDAKKTAAPVGRPRKWNNVVELQEKIDAYFAECEEKGEMPLITGLAVYLDTFRVTILEYANGKYEPEFSNAFKKAKERCSLEYEKGAVNGRVPVPVAIFALKNYGWSDRQEVDVSANVNITYENYLDNIDDDKDSEY